MSDHPHATSEPDDDACELHASAVAIRRHDAKGDNGVLILGPPSAGKSELALALVARGGCLIADDRVALRRDDHGAVIASASVQARALACEGVIDIRGVGLLRLPHRAAAPVTVACRLLPHGRAAPRLPRKEHINLCGAQIRVIETSMSCALADALYLLGQSDALLDPDAGWPPTRDEKGEPT